MRKSIFLWVIFAILFVFPTKAYASSSQIGLSVTHLKSPLGVLIVTLVAVMVLTKPLLRAYYYLQTCWKRFE